MKPIGVGIIGASEQSWAAVAHVPAIQSLPDFELRAIATSRLESAESAARTFGVGSYFGDSRQLVVHPEVQMVVAAINVPKHRDVVEATLNAGKIVFFEWPLAIGLDAAASIAEKARSKGVRTAIGLQARFGPAIDFFATRQRSGYAPNTERRARRNATVHELDVPEAHGGIAANVRSLYRALAGDIRENTQLTPDFEYALRRHRLLASLEKANETGTAQRPD
jgi:predicted dehydrogenase